VGGSQRPRDCHVFFFFGTRAAVVERDLDCSRTGWISRRKGGVLNGQRPTKLVGSLTHRFSGENTNSSRSWVGELLAAVGRTPLCYGGAWRAAAVHLRPCGRVLRFGVLRQSTQDMDHGTPMHCCFYWAMCLSQRHGRHTTRLI